MVKVTRKSSPTVKFLTQAIKDLETLQVKVGWFEATKYADGTSVAEVGVVQEYGDPAKGIPSRSFLRTTRTARKDYWARVFENEMRKVLKGEVSVKQALVTLGQIAEGDVRKKITQIQTPKLKDKTVAARLRKMKDGKTIGNLTKPLVESGLLLNTLNSAVDEKT